MFEKYREYGEKFAWNLGSAVVYSAPSILHNAWVNAGSLANLVSPWVEVFNNGFDPRGNLFKKIEVSLNEFIKIAKGDEFKEHKAKCAGLAGIEQDILDNLFTCFQSVATYKGDIKFYNFISCSGMNYSNFYSESKELYAFSACALGEVKTSIAKAKKIYLQIREEMKDFSELLNNYKNNYVKAHLQNSALISSCAHNIGESVELANQKANCFISMMELKTGIAQKMQTFIKCDNLNEYNAVDEFHNTLSLVQCVSDKMVYAGEVAQDGVTVS